MYVVVCISFFCTSCFILLFFWIFISDFTVSPDFSDSTSICFLFSCLFCVLCISSYCFSGFFYFYFDLIFIFLLLIHRYFHRVVTFLYSCVSFMLLKIYLCTFLVLVVLLLLYSSLLLYFYPPGISLMFQAFLSSFCLISQNSGISLHIYHLQGTCFSLVVFLVINFNFRGMHLHFSDDLIIFPMHLCFSGYTFLSLVRLCSFSYVFLFPVCQFAFPRSGLVIFVSLNPFGRHVFPSSVWFVLFLGILVPLTRTSGKKITCLSCLPVMGSKGMMRGRDESKESQHCIHPDFFSHLLAFVVGFSSLYYFYFWKTRCELTFLTCRLTFYVWFSLETFCLWITHLRKPQKLTCLSLYFWKGFVTPPDYCYFSDVRIPSLSSIRVVILFPIACSSFVKLRIALPVLLKFLAMLFLEILLLCCYSFLYLRIAIFLDLQINLLFSVTNSGAQSILRWFIFFQSFRFPYTSSKLFICGKFYLLSLTFFSGKSVLGEALSV